MNYKETIDFLFGSLPQFQVIGSGAYKPGLGTAEAFDKETGYPTKKLKCIHIAGTNGKGSTSSMLYSALRECGLSVGIFTSPHLKDFRERIVVDGETISEEEVVSFVENHRDFIGRIKPSFFEMTSAMAFDFFAKNNVDFAVIEVGLGGRLDSTNIITPAISVITNIAFDHMALLGSTIPEIAKEKAGIIKHDIPVVIGEYQSDTEAVFKEKACEVSAPLYFAENMYGFLECMNNSNGTIFFVKDISSNETIELTMSLTGEYQQKNVITALAVADLLARKYSLPINSLRDGISKATIPGRWQILSKAPLTVCDTGHNPAGIRYVASQIKKQSYEKLYFILGIVSDKDFEGISHLLPRNAYYLFTQASIPRAMPYEKLAALSRSHGLEGESIPTIAEAIARARELATENDMIFIGGSTFTVAEAL